MISWLFNTGNSSANVKDSLMSAESPEFWCQNSLLKLQSLLCCNLCKGASCKSIVQGYLDIKPGIVIKILLHTYVAKVWVSLQIMKLEIILDRNN